MSGEITIRPVASRADRRAFVDLAWEVYRDDPCWVPPLKEEVHGLINPNKNPWFGHGQARFWLAERGGKAVGRISGQVDELVQQHMAPGEFAMPRLRRSFAHHSPSGALKRVSDRSRSACSSCEVRTNAKLCGAVPGGLAT